MKLFTIGFTKKDARKFFNLLKNNNIRLLSDIRLNNVSQLAGYSKGKDLEYFLTEFLNISYLHDINLAPTKDILDKYKKGDINWQQYENLYTNLLNTRNVLYKLNENYKNNFDGICLLCSELTPDNCHRRLAAEYIKQHYPELEIEIIHL